jgi:hypothetical protein
VPDFNRLPVTRFAWRTHVIFPTTIYLGRVGSGFSTQGGKKTTTLADHFKDLPDHRICSLSRDISDVRLWSFYAKGHTGVAIEVDFSSHEKDSCAVVYSPGLPMQGATLLDSQSPKNLLCCKTNHWSYESEHRIISGDEYYPVTGRIKRIIAGHRASDKNLELLKKVVPQIPIIKAKIDPQTVKVTFDAAKESVP